MEELELGPNGGLVYCMEYLLDNMDWLKDELDEFDDDEYIIFDCPGQVRTQDEMPPMFNATVTEVVCRQRYPKFTPDVGYEAETPPVFTIFKRYLSTGQASDQGAIIKPV